MVCSPSKVFTATYLLVVFLVSSIANAASVKVKRISLFTALLLVTQMATAASVTLSNSSNYLNTLYLEHQVGASTSSYVDNPSYASAYASSSYLSVFTSSSVDGSTIDQLGLDYAIAEAVSWYEADMIISGGTGNALLDIDIFYDEIVTDNPNTFIHGEQRIRIFDDTGDLVFAYLHGVSYSNELDNILLGFDSTYRLRISSTAYTKADAGFLASNQREFAASLAVSAVPIPAATWLFGSGLIGLIGIARRKKA